MTPSDGGGRPDAGDGGERATVTMVSESVEIAPQGDEAWLGRLVERGRPFGEPGARWRHNAINLGCLGLVLAAIPASALATAWLPDPVRAVLLGLGFGSLIFSLFTLVVHEASHNQFVILRSPSQRRTVNDLFGWSICLPFLRDYERHWRTGHILHHQRALEDDDPQNCEKYVLEGEALVRKLVKVWLIPFYEFEAYRLWMRDLDDRCPKPEGERSLRNGLRAAGFLGGWALILGWPLLHAPGLTLAVAVIAFKTATSLNFLKSSVEHGGGYRAATDPRLKTRGLTFPMKSLCFPFCITPYHWEHHLVPSIPWYRLPGFRRAVEAEIPADRKDWIYTPPQTLLQRVLLP